MDISYLAIDVQVRHSETAQMCWVRLLTATVRPHSVAYMRIVRPC